MPAVLFYDIYGRYNMRVNIGVILERFSHRLLTSHVYYERLISYRKAGKSFLLKYALLIP